MEAGGGESHTAGAMCRCIWPRQILPKRFSGVMACDRMTRSYAAGERQVRYSRWTESITIWGRRISNYETARPLRISQLVEEMNTAFFSRPSCDTIFRRLSRLDPRVDPKERAA